MYTLLSLLFAVLLCAYILEWCYVRSVQRSLANPPTYTRLPLLGNIHHFFGGSRFIYNHLVNMSRVSDEKKLPFLVWLGPTPILLVSDLDDVRVITNSYVKKPYLYNFGRLWLGNGLVTAPVSIWKRNIKKLAGTFTVSIVDGFQDIFNAQAQRLVNQLKLEVGRQPFDAMHTLSSTTLEAICQTALGVPYISDSIVTMEYYQAFNRILELFISRGINLFFHPDFIYRLTPAYRELVQCVKVMHNVSETVMTKRRKEMEEVKGNTPLGKYEQENGRTKFKTFLDVLMELGETDSTLTDKQIQSEVDTIIVGGQETVATTLFFVLLMIGCKPDVQDKMYAEIKEIFGESKRGVCKEDLSRMTYCEAVINETLRLYPPVPGVLRLADRDVRLKSCTVPKGVMCCVNMLGAGRSRRCWGDDALLYRPERWFEEHNPSAALLSFSYGKRACIGKRYAMAILKTILAHCVRELVFESEADKLELKIEVALKPMSGHLMQVHLRQ